MACNKQSRQCSTSHDVVELTLGWSFGRDTGLFFCEGGCGDDIMW